MPKASSPVRVHDMMLAELMNRGRADMRLPWARHREAWGAERAAEPAGVGPINYCLFPLGGASPSSCWPGYQGQIAQILMADSK